MSGLEAIGFDVSCAWPPPRSDRGDVLVIWNRYAHWEQAADRFEAQGGIVVVAENGYLGPGGVSPHDMEPRCWYALARHAHNGRGQWHSGGPERFDALRVTLKPWRTAGEHILVCANRSFGMKGGVMPLDWSSDVTARLRKLTRRPIVVRLHPGNGKPAVPVEHHLRNAWAVVIWSSSVGVQALIEGIPVICEAPWWICKPAACVDWNTLSRGGVYGGHRQRALEALAWAQWSVEEIATGEPFRYLLRAAG